MQPSNCRYADYFMCYNCGVDMIVKAIGNTQEHQIHMNSSLNVDLMAKLKPGADKYTNGMAILEVY